MIALGIDPGTSATAIALWDADGPVFADLIRAKRGPGPGPARLADALLFYDQEDLDSAAEGGSIDRVVIEGQQKDRRTKSFANIITLAQSAGVATAWAKTWFPNADFYIPTPSEWKGQVEKSAHQARLYTDLGWGYTIHGSGKNKYARPVKPWPHFEHIQPGAWKDVGDALRLAQWAYDQD